MMTTWELVIVWFILGAAFGASIAWLLINSEIYFTLRRAKTLIKQIDHENSCSEEDIQRNASFIKKVFDKTLKQTIDRSTQSNDDISERNDNSE